MKKRKRYTTSKPIITKKTQTDMKTIENISRMIPDEKAQMFSKGVRIVRFAGNNIREKSEIIRVDGHYRTINGRKVFIKSHPRIIKKYYRIKY